jgi:hypothetical protein
VYQDNLFFRPRIRRPRALLILTGFFSPVSHDDIRDPSRSDFANTSSRRAPCHRRLEHITTPRAWTDHLNKQPPLTDKAPISPTHAEPRMVSPNKDDCRAATLVRLRPPLRRKGFGRFGSRRVSGSSPRPCFRSSLVIIRPDVFHCPTM